MLQNLTWLIVARLLLQSHNNVFTQAFSVPTEHSDAASVRLFRGHRPSVTALSVHAEDEHGDFFDVEATRKKLESLVAGAGRLDSFADALVSRKPEDPKPRPAFTPSSIEQETFASLTETPVLDISLPVRSPLTTIERERRQAELELLATLSQGDESLPDIWDLWFSERGSHAAKLLHRADDLINDGAQGWKEAEEILRGLIDEHGVYFAEPINRLATMYYLQGRLEEALTLNSIVLSVKPWHFGALSHIVMVYAALGENKKARQWAAFRLPTFSPNSTSKRRSRWVDRAVAEATLLLDDGERELTKIFGSPDEGWIETQNKLQSLYEGDGGAWQ